MFIEPIEPEFASDFFGGPVRELAEQEIRKPSTLQNVQVFQAIAVKVTYRDAVVGVLVHLCRDIDAGAPVIGAAQQLFGPRPLCVQ